MRGYWGGSMKYIGLAVAFFLSMLGRIGRLRAVRQWIDVHVYIWRSDDGVLDTLGSGGLSIILAVFALFTWTIAHVVAAPVFNIATGAISLSALGALARTIYAISRSTRSMSRLRLSEPGVRWRSEKAPELTLLNQSVRIEDLKVNDQYAELGFEMLTPLLGTAAIEVSEEIDNSLIVDKFSRPITWPVTKVESKSLFIKTDPSTYDAQCGFLLSKTLDQADTDPLINETKLCPEIRFEKSKNRVEVKARKGSYFDFLITNEAFKHTVAKAETYPKPSKNLTPYFPATPIKNSKENEWALAPLNRDIYRTGDHLGVTTLAISADGYPLLLKQKSGQFVQPGSPVVTGSGSSDWGDWRNSGSSDLVDIAAYGMAREMIEEGKLKFGFLDHLWVIDHFAIRGLAKRTLVLGFFRWVDRGGKPEFIGVTRLPKTREKYFEHFPEGNSRHETARLYYEHRFTPCKNLEELANFAHWYEQELNSEENVKRHKDDPNKFRPLSLSSAACFERIIQIATYANSSDTRLRDIFNRVDNHLFGKSLSTR